MTRLLLALLLLTACGCVPDLDHDGVPRVVGVGDSNTASGWPTPADLRWASLMAPSRLTWSESALGGSTACDPGDGWPWGMTLLDIARTQEHADAVVLALGTNDLGRLNLSPTVVIDCIIAVADAAAPLDVYVALVPPAYVNSPALTAKIDSLNALITAAFPASRIVDFSSGFTPDLYLADGVHLNRTGQELRASRAAAVVR